MALSIPTPLDLITRELAMRYGRIQGEVTGFVRSVLPFTRGTISPDSPGPNDNAPKPVKTSWGEELGYLVDMSYFPRRYFPDHVIELIDYSDRRNKEIHKGESRKKGGVYDNHPLGMLALHFQIAEEIAPLVAKSIGAKVEDVIGYVFDAVSVIGYKRHDDGEDHKDVKEPAKRFKEARTLAMRVDHELTQDTPERREMMKWRDITKEERSKVITGEHSMQLDASHDIASRHNLNNRKRSSLIITGNTAMGVIDWMARHIEDKFFTESMYGLRQRFRVDEYIKDKRGGPFQPYLMEQLRIKGLEPLSYVFRREYGKLLDRVLNSRERKPRYTTGLLNLGGQAGELESLFKQHAWLRDTFGDKINFRVIDGLSRPELMEELYKNSVVLNAVDHTLNSNYVVSLVTRPAKDPVAYAYLLATIRAREYLIGESKTIISELIGSYKAELGKIAEDIESRVERMPPERFRRVDGQGPISHGYLYEIGLDANVEVKGGVQIPRNYEDVLIYERLMDNFMSVPNVLNALKKRIPLFIIEGLNEGISFNIREQPFRRV